MNEEEMIVTDEGLLTTSNVGYLVSQGVLLRRQDDFVINGELQEVRGIKNPVRVCSLYCEVIDGFRAENKGKSVNYILKVLRNRGVDIKEAGSKLLLLRKKKKGLDLDGWD